MSTPTVTPEWHANKRWVPEEDHLKLKAELEQSEAEVTALMSVSAAEMVDSAQAIALDAQMRNLRLLERIRRLEEAGNTLAILHLAPSTPEERVSDSKAWRNAREEAAKIP